jgi:hypothetical protein
VKKIALVINGREMVRSYLQTNLFNKFPEDWNLYLYTPPGCVAPEEVPSRFVSWSQFEGKFHDKKLFLFFDILRWRNRKRSVSFRTRNRRLHPELRFFISRFMNSRVLSTQVGNGLYQKSDLSGTSKPLYGLWRFFEALKRLFISSLVKRPILSLFANQIFFPIATAIIRPKAIRHQQLLRLLKVDQPDLIIYPTSGFETLTLDLVNIGKKLNSKTMYVFDNWDNLSSKTVMWAFPDYICTWGEQSSKHANQIGNFPKSRIFEVGSARFTSYKRPQKSEMFSLPSRYILFVGSFLHSNETQVLKLLDAFLLKLNSHKDLTVIYRPHPESHLKNSFQPENFQRVVLDPQISELLNKSPLKIGGNLGELSLDYYPQLISNAEIVIGGLSSMLIEATIFQKPYISLEHNEPGNPSNPAAVRNSYTHLKEIEQLSNLIPCKDLRHLPRMILDLLNGELSIDLTNCLKNLDYFVKSDVASYPDRLECAVKSALSS